MQATLPVRRINGLYELLNELRETRSIGHADLAYLEGTGPEFAAWVARVWDEGRHDLSHETIDALRDLVLPHWRALQAAA